jgi:hypothetical protein
MHIKMDNHVATKSEKHILKLFYQNNRLLPHSKEFGAFLFQLQLSKYAFHLKKKTRRGKKKSVLKMGF